MVSPSGDEPPSLRLSDVLQTIDQFDDGLTLYIATGEPIDLATTVVLIDEDMGEPPNGVSYLLEVHLVRNVLQVWKEWRGGQEPTLTEACAAVGFYASHDAYQPIDQD